jgi:hypothetical protein
VFESAVGDKGRLEGRQEGGENDVVEVDIKPVQGWRWYRGDKNWCSLSHPSSLKSAFRGTSRRSFVLAFGLSYFVLSSLRKGGGLLVIRSGPGGSVVSGHRVTIHLHTRNGIRVGRSRRGNTYMGLSQDPKKQIEKKPWAENVPGCA